MDREADKGAHGRLVVLLVVAALVPWGILLSEWLGRDVVAQPPKQSSAAELAPKETKAACTDKLEEKLDAHFKGKGWVHWHFACLGNTLHASYLAGMPGFNQEVMRGDIEYLQDFYSGEIFVLRFYEDRTLGVCRFADGEIACDTGD